MNQYGDCYYCGGMVENKIERIDYRYHILQNIRGIFFPLPTLKPSSNLVIVLDNGVSS